MGNAFSEEADLGEISMDGSSTYASDNQSSTARQHYVSTAPESKVDPPETFKSNDRLHPIVQTASLASESQKTPSTKEYAAYAQKESTVQSAAYSQKGSTVRSVSYSQKVNTVQSTAYSQKGSQNDYATTGGQFAYSREKLPSYSNNDHSIYSQQHYVADVGQSAYSHDKQPASLQSFVSNGPSQLDYFQKDYATDTGQSAYSQKDYGTNAEQSSYSQKDYGTIAEQSAYSQKGYASNAERPAYSQDYATNARQSVYSHNDYATNAERSAYSQNDYVTNEERSDYFQKDAVDPKEPTYSQKDYAVDAIYSDDAVNSDNGFNSDCAINSDRAIQSGYDANAVQSTTSTVDYDSYTGTQRDEVGNAFEQRQGEYDTNSQQEYAHTTKGFSSDAEESESSAMTDMAHANSSSVSSKSITTAMSRDTKSAASISRLSAHSAAEKRAGFDPIGSIASVSSQIHSKASMNSRKSALEGVSQQAYSPEGDNSSEDNIPTANRPLFHATSRGFSSAASQTGSRARIPGSSRSNSRIGNKSLGSSSWVSSSSRRGSSSHPTSGASVGRGIALANSRFGPALVDANICDSSVSESYRDGRNGNSRIRDNSLSGDSRGTFRSTTDPPCVSSSTRVVPSLIDPPSVDSAPLVASPSPVPDAPTACKVPIDASVDSSFAANPSLPETTFDSSVDPHSAAGPSIPEASLKSSLGSCSPADPSATSVISVNGSRVAGGSINGSRVAGDYEASSTVSKVVHASQFESVLPHDKVPESKGIAQAVGTSHIGGYGITSQSGGDSQPDVTSQSIRFSQHDTRSQDADLSQLEGTPRAVGVSQADVTYQLECEASQAGIDYPAEDITSRTAMISQPEGGASRAGMTSQVLSGTYSQARMVSQLDVGSQADVVSPLGGGASAKGNIYRQAEGAFRTDIISQHNGVTSRARMFSQHDDKDFPTIMGSQPDTNKDSHLELGSSLAGRVSLAENGLAQPNESIQANTVPPNDLISRVDADFTSIASKTSRASKSSQSSRVSKASKAVSQTSKTSRAASRESKNSQAVSRASKASLVASKVVSRASKAAEAASRAIMVAEATSGEDKYVSATSRAEKSVSAASRAEKSVSAASRAEKSVSAASRAEKSVSAASRAEKSVSAASRAEKSVSAASRAEKSVSAASRAEKSVSAASRAEKSVSAASRAEKSVSAASRAEKSVSAASRAEKSVSAASRAEKSVSAASRAEKSVSAASRAEKSVSAASRAEKSVSAASRAEKSVSAASRAEKSVLAASRAEKSVSAASRAEKSVSAASRAEKSVSAASRAEKSVSAASRAEKSVSAASRAEKSVLVEKSAEKSVSAASRADKSASARKSAEKSLSAASRAKKSVSATSRGEKSVSATSRGEKSVSATSRAEKSVSAASKAEKSVSADSRAEKSVSADSRAGKSFSADSRAEKSVSSKSRATFVSRVEKKSTADVTRTMEFADKNYESTEETHFRASGDLHGEAGGNMSVEAGEKEISQARPASRASESSQVWASSRTSKSSQMTSRSSDASLPKGKKASMARQPDFLTLKEKKASIAEEYESRASVLGSLQRLEMQQQQLKDQLERSLGTFSSLTCNSGPKTHGNDAPPVESTHSQVSEPNPHDQLHELLKQHAEEEKKLQEKLQELQNEADNMSAEVKAQNADVIAKKREQLEPPEEDSNFFTRNEMLDSEQVQEAEEQLVEVKEQLEKVQRKVQEVEAIAMKKLEPEAQLSYLVDGTVQNQAFAEAEAKAEAESKAEEEKKEDPSATGSGILLAEDPSANSITREEVIPAAPAQPSRQSGANKVEDNQLTPDFVDAFDKSIHKKVEEIEKRENIEDARTSNNDVVALKNRQAPEQLEGQESLYKEVEEKDGAELRGDSQKEEHMQEHEEVSPSVTGDDDIDLDFVEKYDNAFNHFLGCYPEFFDKSAELIQNLKVAKLQKMLEITDQVECELVTHLETSNQIKTSMEEEYQKKLRDASRKKAARTIQLQSDLSYLRQKTKVTEGKLTWEMLSKATSRAAKLDNLSKQLRELNVGTKRESLSALLTDSQDSQEIRVAMLAPASTSFGAEQMKELQQLQVDNGFLKAEVTVLQKKLAYQKSASKKHAWVDSVLLRLDTKKLRKLKHRYQKKLGINF